jgi:hypothetical protein
MLQLPTESDKSLHFISDSDTPNPHQFATENDLSIKAKTNEPKYSDCGSFSESSIHQNDFNLTLAQNRIDEETRSVKS